VENESQFWYFVSSLRVLTHCLGLVSLNKAFPYRGDTIFCVTAAAVKSTLHADLSAGEIRFLVAIAVVVGVLRGLKGLLAGSADGDGVGGGGAVDGGCSRV
jgi:hypothetical protein